MPPSKCPWSKGPTVFFSQMQREEVMQVLNAKGGEKPVKVHSGGRQLKEELLYSPMTSSSKQQPNRSITL